MKKTAPIDRLLAAGAAVAALVLAARATTLAEPRAWTPEGGSAVTGEYRGLVEGVVAIDAGGRTESIPFDKLAPADKRAVVDAENGPLPAKAPAWVPGYKVRYLVRVAGDPLESGATTVLVRIPTGGWLKPDASDVLVQTAGGRVASAAVLSHDPAGHTLVQFNRSGCDRWYWVYAVNPSPLPLVDPALRKRMEETDAAARQALLDKMKLQKASADAAEKLRELTDQLHREQATTNAAAREIGQWDKLIPERQAAQLAAEAKVPPAEEALGKAEAAVAPAQAAAAEKLAAVQKAKDEAAAAKAAADKAAEEQRAAAARGAALGEAERMRLVSEAEAALAAARKLAEAREAAIKAAEDAALPARMEAARVETEREKAKADLAQAQAAAAASRAAVKQGEDARAAAAALRAKSDQAIAGLEPQVPPLEAAAEAARTASAEAVERARALTEAYKALAFDADPTSHQEGLTLEVRQWGGEQLDELSDWAVVVQGLERSDNVLGNAVVTEVLQNANPFRPSDPRNFAASYRGYLRIEKAGIYRFFVNGDDASFLFIDGYKVYSRVGSNRPVSGTMPLYSVGADIELEAGVHPFEIHGVVGHTPGAQGLCSFVWLEPGSKTWARVPASAFAAALPGVPVRAEAWDGGPVAIPQCGIDDTLASGGLTLHLARFEASGAGKGAAAWTFGDGTAAAGASLTHLYFQGGDYEVTLKSHPALPSYKRRLHVWMAPVPTSPLSLARAVEVLSGDVPRLDPARLGAAFDFLLLCGQDSRWPVMEKVCRRLLEAKVPDLKYRILLTTSLMEALARQGRAAEALPLGEKALADAGALRTLQVDVLLKIADIYRVHLKDFDRAGDAYARLIEENRRLDYAGVRRAAVSWGDMFLEAGDMARAGEKYRLAATLGAQGGAAPSTADVATRGALLRVAEQQLRGGDIRQTWRLLERIENEFPEQKLEGLYRYLRGETDRSAGRYEQALKHYEVLLNLRQWAGYRAPAMFGVADCYYRNGDFAKSLEWISGLQESFPAYFESRALGPYKAVIEGRLQRQQEAAASGQAASNAPFAGLSIAFSATNPPPAPGLRYRFVPSMGIDGPDTLFIDYVTDSSSQAYGESFRNVVSEGTYWVEFWYRNLFAPARAVTNPHVHIDFVGDGGVHASRQTVLPDRTFGEWAKLAAPLKASVTKDGRVSLLFVFFNGVNEIDGLRVVPVSDRQQEALRNFIEGLDTP